MMMLAPQLVTRVTKLPYGVDPSYLGYQTHVVTTQVRVSGNKAVRARYIVLSTLRLPTKKLKRLCYAALYNQPLHRCWPTTYRCRPASRSGSSSSPSSPASSSSPSLPSSSTNSASSRGSGLRIMIIKEQFRWDHHYYSSESGTAIWLGPSPYNY